MSNISNSTLSKNNTSKDISVKAIISEFPKAALLWYGFKKDTDILYIYDGEKNSAIQELLMTFGRCVDVVAVSDIQNCADMSCNNWSGTRYDYIVGMGVLEECDNPHELLSTLKA